MQTPDIKKLIQARFEGSIAVKQAIIKSELPELLEKIAVRIADVLQSGGKILFCGNGGSAADAQHLAAELLVRLRSSFNRRSLPAIALAMDSSTMTACGNDYGYDDIYARMIEGLGKPGDLLVGITTSGNSKNVLKAFDAARVAGITCVGFLGGNGGAAAARCDVSFIVPSDSTAHIQEAHITAGHAIIEAVEELLLARHELKRL